MDKKQATIIIILLAAILFVLLAGRIAALDLLGNLFWGAVGVFIVVVVARVAKDSFSDWLARSRAKKRKELYGEIEELCREISTYPAPRLTAEHIPQRFPSKEAAQTFGERWSRGGPESFSARAVDVQSRSEELPGFDKTSICGGFLYTYPALFFGMREAHRDDDAWWLDFLRAKKRWLIDYRDNLRSP